jgi:hypothetical protein
MSTIEWFAIIGISIILTVIIGVSMYRSGKVEGKVETQAELGVDRHGDTKVMTGRQRAPTRSY